MPRPPLVLMALALAVSACGSSVSADTVSTTRPPEPTTVTTAPSTTTTIESPTTTVASTTTTTAITIENSPVDALSSFRWDFNTAISAASADALDISSSGTFSDGDFRCDVTAGLAGLEFTSGVVVAAGGAYLDAGAGEGFQPIEGNDPELVDTLGICPGSNVFWADIVGGEPLPEGGEPETTNGLRTRRLDLTELVTEATGLGLFPSTTEGLTFDQLVFWVTEDSWISAIEMSADLTPEALTRLTGTSSDVEGRLEVRVDVTDPNEPDLAVTLP